MRREMDRYAVVVKISFVRSGSNMEDALRKALAELPDDALLLEAQVFPARVKGRIGDE